MQNHVSNDFNFSVCLNAPGAADGLALISARGADAGSFLQGQLTNDVLLMKENEARLAAWCSAKGRMLSSFIVWKNSPEEFYLLMSADLLTVTLKRLKMFVLRAKCVLTDETANYQVMGLVGELANTMNLGALRADFMPAGSPKSLEKAILLPPGWHAQQAIPRALHIMPANTTALHDAILSARWNYLEVTSGIARITTSIHEAFVPQMLNYESVGGVNFKKGCYPGQEPEQPCGLVAQAASDLQGGCIAVVSMQTAAASRANLHAGAAHGAKLQMLSLPYALLDDV
jgi:tRNA-modifying protein YgfZ